LVGLYAVGGKNAMKDINEIVEKIRIWPIDKIYQY
jgi:hypothetical protein